MVLIYKKSVIHPLPNNQRMKEFFYDKNLNTNKAVTDIKQDREAQEKHKEYFRKIVFETINEFLQDFHDETSRDAYKQRIEQTYKMKITNTYSNMKVDSP